MRNKLIGLALIIATGGTVVSCNKDEKLNKPPQTSVSEASAFSTPARIANQVLSLYSNLKSGTFYGGRYLVYNEVRGENFLNVTSNLVTASDVWKMNPTNSATSVTGLWRQAFRTINFCNVFLEGMDKTGTAVINDAAVSNRYKAEARLVRAVCYYSLLQLFARPYADGAGSKPGLPMRTTAITGLGFTDMARGTVAEGYKLVTDDLDFAESNLSLTNTGANNNTIRAHRNTAIALKTRVYLSMQMYDKVITEANKIVSATAPFTATTGVTHALQADINTIFKSSYTTTESIFSLPMSSTSGDNPGTQNSLTSYFYMAASTPGATEFNINPAGIVSNANWKSTDRRRVFLTTVGSSQYMSKFTTASPYTDYVPVIRYAEVLLNLAEAKARQLQVVDAQAVALLNAVRQRSDNTTTFAPATAAELISLIMIERQIELLGEGLRGPDITRLLGTFPGKGSAPLVSPADAGYIFPISSDELSLNKLMTDN